MEHKGRKISLKEVAQKNKRKERIVCSDTQNEMKKGIRQWIDDICLENGLTGVRGYLACVIGIGCSCFFLYTAYYGSFPNMVQRAILFMWVLPIIFMTKPIFQRPKALALIVDLLLCIAALCSMYYITYDVASMGWRVGAPNTMDIIMGTIAVLVIIEATRRKVGIIMPILSFVFILYGFFGPSLPGVLRHRGLDLSDFISGLYMGQEGIFGTPAGVAANFIMVYILFGAFLKATGAGDFFTKLAEAGFGWARGGPAKGAVVSSGLMGMISGSAVANVVTTGTFTIPMMRKTGYTAETAGAVEAVASTGGQIMPPIMGAAAFIMADYLGVPYWSVVKAAIFPAFLYYLTLYMMVDLEAGKRKLHGQPKELLPKVKDTLKESGHLLIPIFVLVYLLGVVKYSAQKSAFWSILLVIICSMFRKHTRIKLKKFVSCLVDGALSGVEVAAVCGCAGIVIGILMRTGLGMTLSSVLVSLSNGNLVVLMILTMIVSMIMGMGLPTSACYIIVATFIAPAMVEMGVIPMAAHLFAFYYACLSTITPPVALASYAAAGVAKCSPMKVGLESVRLGSAGFIVPFMFVFGNGLLLEGGVLSIIQAVVTASVGGYALSVGLTGYQFTQVSPLLRVVYLAAALLLIAQGGFTDLIGIVLLIVATVVNVKKKRVAAAQ